MIRGHGKKKPPTLLRVDTVPAGDVDIIEGTPITAVAKGIGTDNLPFPITVEGWESTNPAVLSVTAGGVITFVSVGDADIRPKVNGVLWS